jgi:hypothetical protein
MTKETELRQMRLEVNRSVVVMERVKNDMSESLHAVEEELERRGGMYKFMLYMSHDDYIFSLILTIIILIYIYICHVLLALLFTYIKITR